MKNYGNSTNIILGDFVCHVQVLPGKFWGIIYLGLTLLLPLKALLLVTQDFVIKRSDNVTYMREKSVTVQGSNIWHFLGESPIVYLFFHDLPWFYALCLLVYLSKWSDPCSLDRTFSWKSELPGRCAAALVEVQSSTILWREPQESPVSMYICTTVQTFCHITKVQHTFLCLCMHVCVCKTVHI